MSTRRRRLGRIADPATRYSSRHDHIPARARRHPRARPLPRHRGPLVRGPPGRLRRRRHQGGGHGRGRRVAHLAAQEGRRDRRVPPLQPEQARRDARPQVSRRCRGDQGAGAEVRRARRELSHRHDGELRPRLRRARRDQPAPHLLLGLRLRPHRAAQGQPGLRSADAGVQRHHVHHRRARRPARPLGGVVPRPHHRHPLRARRHRGGAPARAHRARPARRRLPAGHRRRTPCLPRGGLPARRPGPEGARLRAPVAVALSQLHVQGRAMDLHRRRQ